MWFSIKKGDFPEAFQRKVLIALLAVFLLFVLMYMVSASIFSAYHDNSALNEQINSQKLLFHQLHHNASQMGRGEQQQVIQEMASLNDAWTENHFALQFGIGGSAANTNTLIHQKFSQVQPHKDEISDALKSLLLVANDDRSRKQMLKKICKHEAAFLGLMEEINDVYTLEANDKIDGLLQIQQWIMLLSFILMAYLFMLTNNLHLVLVIPDAVKSFFINIYEPETQEHIVEPIFVDYPILLTSTNTDKSGTHPKPKLLIIKDRDIPVDYLAWFLNKCDFDFQIANQPKEAEELMHNDSHLILLISKQLHESRELDKQSDAIQKAAKVIFEQTDVYEIHTYIHQDGLLTSEHSPIHEGKLYQKIKKQFNIARINS